MLTAIATVSLSGDLLYDQDAHGAYLQIYTRSFAERFFFELVERRGYAGLGAANAAVRLAAQIRRRRAGREAARTTP